MAEYSQSKEVDEETVWKAAGYRAQGMKETKVDEEAVWEAAGYRAQGTKETILI